jgi:hypothetical protein
VIKGILDQVVLLVSKDLKDQGVVPEVMEKLVPKETQGSLAPRDYQDPQELMDHLDLLDLRDLKVLRDHRVTKE